LCSPFTTSANLTESLLFLFSDTVVVTAAFLRQDFEGNLDFTFSLSSEIVDEKVDVLAIDMVSGS